MSVVNSLMVCLSDNTSELLEKYCEHVVSNVKNGLDVGKLNPDDIVALNEVVNYVPILISDKIENIAQVGMSPIKAPNFSCMVVSGFIRDNDTGLYSIRFQLDTATASEIETSLSVANIHPDDVTVWMVVPVLQCRNSEIMEQVSACLMGIISDVSFQININDLKIKRAKMTANKKLIPINSEEFEISYIYLMNLGIWCLSTEWSFIMNNINHATLSDCPMDCCNDRYGELSLIKKLEKTREDSSFVLQPSITIMGNQSAKYNLAYKARKQNTPVVSDSIQITPQYGWLSKDLMSRTVKDNGDIAFDVVPLSKAPDLTTLDKSRISKKKPKVVPKEIVKATPDIALDSTDEDWTITKIHPETTGRDANLFLRPFSQKNKETISGAGVKKGISFPADLTEIISPGKSRMASTAIKDLVTRRLNISSIRTRPINIPDDPEAEDDEIETHVTPPPGQPLSPSVHVIQPPNQTTPERPATPGNNNNNNQEDDDGNGATSELTSQTSNQSNPGNNPAANQSHAAMERLLNSLHELTQREETFLDARNRQRLSMMTQLATKMAAEEPTLIIEEQQQSDNQNQNQENSIESVYVETSDEPEAVGREPAEEDRLVDDNLETLPQPPRQ